MNGGKPGYRFFDYLKRHHWTHLPIIALIALIVLAASLIVYLGQGLPSIAELESYEPLLVTKIYSVDGVLIDELDAQEKRESVSYFEMPDNLIQATIATEDRRFYKHWGLDIKRIAKAAYVNVTTMSRSQGAGTITGQLARDLYLNRKKTWKRKFQEALTVLQIERTYSKNEILELYLNQMSFGHHAFGVQAASEEFFDKDVGNLKTEEAALIVGLLKAPNLYSPFRHPDRALQRRNIVLASMMQCNYITRAVFDSLKALPLNVVEEKSDENAIAPYFCEYVRQEMSDKYGLSLYTDGLSIYTTLDTRVQAVAEKATNQWIGQLESDIHKTMLAKRKYTQWVDPPLTTPQDIVNFLKDTARVDSFFHSPRMTLQTSLVAMNPTNGQVIAMIGGRDFEKTKFNRAVQMERQPGSSFKPFMYTVAIDNGWPTTTELWNQPIVLKQVDGTQWRPNNYDMSVGGKPTIRQALQHSYNLASAHLLLKIIQSPELVVSYAKRFGFTSTIYPYETICLGASDVKLLDLVAAYGVFANKGELIEPICVTRVEDKDGNIIDEFPPKRKEVINENTAYVMTDLLETAINEGTGQSARWKYNFYRPAAGKTGTSNDFTNALFLGFTPQIAAGVWIGFDNQNIKLGEGKTGGMAALPIWAPFMKMAHDTLNLPVEDFVMPPGVIRLDICDETKKLATDACPHIVKEIFIKKYAPTETCDVHGSPGKSRSKKQIVF